VFAPAEGNGRLRRDRARARIPHTRNLMRKNEENLQNSEDFFHFSIDFLHFFEVGPYCFF